MDGGLWEAAAPPSRVVDAGLAVALAVAITVAITVGPGQGDEPDALAYGLGLVIAALSLFRRRWPLGVLLASAAVLIFYNRFDYPGLFSAVPLSVSLATAWTAGHRRWALAVAAWFGFTPLVFLAVSDLPGEFAARLVGGAVSDLALLAAVLLLGEAVRTRRALDQEHRLLVAEQERSGGCCSTSCRRRSPPGSSPARNRSPTASPRSPCSSPTWSSSPAGAGRSARRRSWRR